MIKTVITGGSGFIGGHLLKKIQNAHSVNHNSVGFTALEFSPYDRLFFLSTYGNMASHTNNKEMVGANVIDLLNVIRRGDGWICYMSSSSVTLPVQTPYSRTKRAAEEILQALPELKSCIVRPYSVTGVGEQKEHLIPTLIRSCMEGEEMPFDPYPVHDFVDVDDVVERLIHLADYQLAGIYHFGSGIPTSNQQVRDMVEYACGKKAHVKEVQGIRKYDNPNWYCREPSFAPYKKSLYQSISEMVEAYKREHA